MKYRPHLPGQLCGLHFQQRMSIHHKVALYLAGIKVWDQTVEGADQRGLATAAPPGQENKFAGLHRHINAPEGKVLALLITKAEILKRDHVTPSTR